MAVVVVVVGGCRMRCGGVMRRDEFDTDIE